MLETEKPDVVSLIVPVHLTKSMAIDIMKKGFNIILEKPPGKDVAYIETAPSDVIHIELSI